MSNPASKYADDEMVYFPEHWDENTKNLVKFIIVEAFNAGQLKGYESGLVRAGELAIEDAKNRLESTKEWFQKNRLLPDRADRG